MTATPINNSMHDFRYLLELFTHREEAYFRAEHWNQELRAAFRSLGKQVKETLARAQGTPAEAEQIELDVELADKTLRRQIIPRTGSATKSRICAS